MSEAWHVLGAGAIGCLFATSLHRAGIETTLVQRSTGGAGWPTGAQTTISLKTGAENERHTVGVTAASETGEISHLLLTTKAHDAAAALASVAHRLNTRSQVLLLINGMGVAEELAAAAPRLALYCGTTTEGAYRTSEREIVHAGTGQTRIGRPGVGAPPGWFAPWEKLTLRCQWEPDIETALWQKLAINCAINPLSALHACANGALLTRPELKAQLPALCDEISAVACSTGQSFGTDWLYQETLEVLRLTAANRSSMHQDVLAGRPTEIEYLTGYLVTVAEETGVATPINTKLLHGIRALQR